MATKALVSLEEYLRTSYEHDVDFVEGETVERGMASDAHSDVQMKLVQAFTPISRRQGLALRTEPRLRVTTDRVRIADFCAFLEKPRQSVPSEPPLIVVEILSPDDRHAILMQRLFDFESWGVSHVWLADPQAKRLARYEHGALLPATKLEAPEIGFTLAAAELFTD